MSMSLPHSSHPIAAAHPLTQLQRALRDADAVLVPIEQSTRDPFGPVGADLLRGLCSSAFARGLVMRASARWTVGSEQISEPLHGLAIIPVRLPRSLGGGRFAAIAILSDALQSETVEQLAQGAAMDARVCKTILRSNGTWERNSLGRLASLVTALATSECGRLAGVDAGTQLSAAWEELHLLHSLSGEMVLGASPMKFATRTLAELRQTLGCKWTVLRVYGSAAQLLGLSSGGILAEGIDTASARAILDAQSAVTRAVVCGSDLVLAPVRRENELMGMLAAGERIGGDGAMSSVERTLVETASGHLSVFLDNARLYRDLDAMFLGALSALVSAIDAKDPYTRGHSQRVALISRQIAESAGMSSLDVKNIHIAGLVHDVGKIGVSEMVLRKQGRLDEAEFDQMKQHPEIGYRILRDIPQFAPVLDGVRFHHERYQGGGYPHGLAATDIPVSARIIAIADTFDAMSSTRTYRAARPRNVVLAEMSRLGGIQFDPVFLAHFLSLDLRAYDAMNDAHGTGFRSSEREAA